jgi:FAD/FMN-containing dehydrogenase
VRERIDPWGVREGPELELQRRVKRQFDPSSVCNPGIFVGGI